MEAKIDQNRRLFFRQEFNRVHKLLQDNESERIFDVGNNLHFHSTGNYFSRHFIIMKCSSIWNSLDEAAKLAYC